MGYEDACPRRVARPGALISRMRPAPTVPGRAKPLDGSWIMRLLVSVGLLLLIGACSLFGPSGQRYVVFFRGSSAQLDDQAIISALIRNYGDVFRDRIFLCGATLCDLSLTRRTCRSRRVKVHLNGLADC